MGDEGRNATSFVILRGVRVDVSALSAGDKIVASINSSSAPTGFVPIGQERTESVGGTVSTVKGGLTVKVGQASRLLCNLEIEAEDNVATQLPSAESRRSRCRRPSPGLGKRMLSVDTDTMITIKMNNLPEGVNLRWPNVVEFHRSYRNRWG